MREDIERAIESHIFPIERGEREVEREGRGILREQGQEGGRDVKREWARERSEI